MASRTRRAACRFALVEASALTPEGAPLVVHQHREVYWSALFRRAQIEPPVGGGRLRPDFSGRVNLGSDPVWCADQLVDVNPSWDYEHADYLQAAPEARAEVLQTLRRRRHNLCLSWLTTVLWLTILHTEPERVRGCGRIYTADDCETAFEMAAQAAADVGLRLWLEAFFCQLGWRWEMRTLKPGQKREHAGQSVVAYLKRARLVDAERAA